MPFLDGQHALGRLTRLEQRIAPALFRPLASLLTQSPDPDGALALLERYAEVAPPEVLDELSLYPSTLTYLVAIFSHSETLGETFLSDPSLVLQFVHDRHFTNVKSVEDLMQDYARYSVTHPDLWLASQLARFKRRNLLRIALKDVLGLSTLGETTVELSTLADVILKNALTYCDQELEKRYGWPQFRDAEGRIARSGFSIVSLGKLGGNELNFSPDIDLLFLYAGDGQTAGGSESSSVIPNKEYFVRLAEAINRTITQATPHGEVYRIDLRARPEGEKGDMAISVKSALEYYDHRARDWELQMLIKARHSAGDLWVTREFLHGVEPYVYRAASSNAIESEPDERERSSTPRRDSHEGALDVKFHPGGIRDIEFLTQCLQRVHGRTDSWVRSGGTLLALRKLNDKGLLPDVDFARLTSSYEFFRKVEHRIQLKAEQHAHRLPVGHAALNRLARRLGMEGGTPAEAGAALVTQLKQTFAIVEEIYKRLVQGQPVSTSSADFQLSSEVVWAPDSGLDHLDKTLRILEARSPDLAQIVRAIPLGNRASADAARLLNSLIRYSEYFRATREQPDRLRRALHIAAVSPYLAQVMIQHPEDLAAFDLLASESAIHSPDQLEIGLSGALSDGIARAPGANGIVSAWPRETPVFPWAADEGLTINEKMALLRTEYRTHVLRLGARDCMALGPIFECLNRWTSLAIRCLASATTMAGSPQPESRVGVPFVTLGLGRMGIDEFDLASRAELAFVVAEGRDGEGMTLGLPLADRTVEALCSYTHDGSVFAVDAFAVPQGAAGLTVTQDVLVEYLREEASLEQLLGIATARPVAGDIELGCRVVTRLTEVLSKRFGPGRRSDDGLRNLFQRFSEEMPVAPSGAQGALVDLGEVELTLTILRLRHCIKLPADANVPNMIVALRSAGHLSARDEEALVQGVSFQRAVDHAVRLVTGLKPECLPENNSRSDEVETLIRLWGLIGRLDSLTKAMAATQARVHPLCQRLLGLA